VKIPFVRLFEESSGCESVVQKNTVRGRKIS
jgi:hypothetical protein